MAWPLPENFKPGTPLRDLITTEIMQTIAGILNSLTVEVREGIEHPYIEKTARPGEQQPWIIVLPAQSATSDVELSDANPEASAVTPSPGISVAAARGDHVHPRPNDPSNSAVVGVDSEGTSGAADTANYNGAAADAAGVSFWVVSRGRYDHTLANPVLYLYMRKITFPAGIAPTISAETRVEIDTPTKVIWSNV